MWKLGQSSYRPDWCGGLEPTSSRHFPNDTLRLQQKKAREVRSNPSLGSHRWIETRSFLVVPPIPWLRRFGCFHQELVYLVQNGINGPSTPPLQLQNPWQADGGDGYCRVWTFPTENVPKNIEKRQRPNKNKGIPKEIHRNTPSAIWFLPDVFSSWPPLQPIFKLLITSQITAFRDLLDAFEAGKAAGAAGVFASVLPPPGLGWWNLGEFCWRECYRVVGWSKVLFVWHLVSKFSESVTPKFQRKGPKLNLVDSYWSFVGVKAPKMVR